MEVKPLTQEQEAKKQAMATRPRSDNSKLVAAAAKSLAKRQKRSRRRS